MTVNIIERVERHLPIAHLASWALAAAACGLLAEIPFLPEYLLSLMMLTFFIV